MFFKTQVFNFDEIQFVYIFSLLPVPLESYARNQG
jgi:hypothetical protein